MEEQEKVEAEIRLAAKSGQHTHTSHEKQTTLTFLYSRSRKRRGTFRTPAAAADLKMGANNMSVVSTSERPPDRSASIFNEQTERERGSHKEEATIKDHS